MSRNFFACGEMSRNFALTIVLKVCIITYILNECIGDAVMPRNKYPEITVAKILEVSLKLFLEKGYEATTIQDIVDELGGLTKGAIYHHFRSKEDIVLALNRQLFFDNNPFATVRERNDLNGLQKMQEAIKISGNGSGGGESSQEMQRIPLLENPRILAGIIDSGRRWISPLWQEFIEEGNRDGSIDTAYPKEMGEVIQLLTNIWMVPSVYPVTPEEMYSKFLFLRDMLESMGIPLVDDEILMMVKQSIKEI